MTGQAFRPGTRVLLFANTDWYLHNFRLPLALALREAGCDVVMVAPRGVYAGRFAEHGLRYVPFEFNRLSLNPVQQMSAVARLAALYRRERPDLVHHFTIKCAVYGSLAAKLVGPPAVVNAFAGLGSAFSEKADRFRHVRRLVISTSRVALSGTLAIVQNPEDLDLMTVSGLATKEQIALIRGSGVNLERFTPRETPRMGPLRVLFASRLIRSKGIGDFESMARRLGSGGDWEFLIAGAPDPGNPDTLTSGELAALRARGHVQLLGHVEDMAALLSTVDIVVLPTRYGEGVPRILIEAAAAGLPLVATDAPGCREIVAPDGNGYLVPPGDIDALAAAVRSLLVDSELRASMGVMSRARSKAFSETRVIVETFGVYFKALGLTDSSDQCRR